MTAAGRTAPPLPGPAPFTRWPAVLAVGLGGLALAVVVGTFPLGSMARQLNASVVASVLVALVFAAVGLLVTLRQPRNSMGWLLLAGGVLIALNFAASFYTVLDYRLGHHLPLGTVALVLQPSWAPGIVSFGLAVMLFPDGRLPSPRLRWILRIYLGIGAVWVGGAVAITIGAIVAGHVRVDSTGNLVNIDDPHGATAWWGIAQIVFFVLLIIVGVGSLAGQVVRFRRSSGERRQQLKWLLSGIVAAMPGLALSIALGGATGWLDVLGGFSFAFLAALPLGIGVAVLRYRLFDIDRLISRTLAYGAVTALLAGAYVGLVLLATRELAFSSEVAVAVSTLAAAAAFNPVRRWVQHLVDRRFNRSRYDADLTVAAFAARLQDDVDIASVRADLAGTVQRALEPEHMSVWMLEA
jgi:MFS family permease